MGRFKEIINCAGEKVSPLALEDVLLGSIVNVLSAPPPPLPLDRVPPGQRPSSAHVPLQGAPGGSGQLGTPRKRPDPQGSQPPPRVLALTASPYPKPYPYP